MLLLHHSPHPVDGVGSPIGVTPHQLFWRCPIPDEIGPAALPVPYSPGVMRCAVVVPAFMIHTPPSLPLSGKPKDCVVAPGTAMVMCMRTWSLSAPMAWYHTDPNTGFTRVPSFSSASSIACVAFLSPPASAFRFCASRSRLPLLLVHSTMNAGCSGKPDL